MWWQLIQDFLYNNWFKIAFILWLFYFARKCGMGWIKEQLDWFKLLFVDDDDISVPNAPSHKNAVMLALVVVFIITFLKKVAFGTTDEIPDIPVGWQMILLGGLGIMAAKTSAQKLFGNKFGNATNGIEKNDKIPPTP